MDKILVIDNGAVNIKYGYVGADVKILGNYVAKGKVEKKKSIGDVTPIRDKSSLNFVRPFHKGYLINWELEKTIWESFLEVESAKETSLLVTSPPFNPDSLGKMQTEVIFEDYGFASLYTTSASVFSMYKAKEELFNNSPCCVVVDTGYSFTHSIPFFDNQKINYAIKRCNIGGKHLTNYLKEIVSYRHWNMMDETWLINIIKERLCYISLDFLRDLEITRLRGAENRIKREYVLPDYVTNHTGFIKEEQTKQLEAMDTSEPKTPSTEQILLMNNERITVPELLFRPSDIGINQAGIAECIVQSIQACHPDMQALLYSHIVVTGGNTLIPNFKERLFQEVRQLAPSEYEVKITVPDDPLTYGWQGGCKFSAHSNFQQFAVTRSEYHERGFEHCKYKFHN